MGVNPHPSDSLNILVWYRERAFSSSKCGTKSREEIGDDFFECHLLTKQSFLDLILSSAFRIHQIGKFLVTIFGSWSTYGKGPPVHLCGTKPGEEIGDDFV